jgi:hypothetical protein
LNLNVVHGILHISQKRELLKQSAFVIFQTFPGVPTCSTSGLVIPVRNIHTFLVIYFSYPGKYYTLQSRLNTRIFIIS